MNKQGWIGFDLDGTLAHYGKWQGEEHIGAPIAGTVSLVKRYLAAGYEVRVFTARVWNEGGDPMRGLAVARVVACVQAWCEKHIGQRLQVTNIKDYEMLLLLYDDRAVRIVRNEGSPCCEQHLTDDHYGLPVSK